MYVLQTRRNFCSIDKRNFATQQLFEMTAKELKAAEQTHNVTHTPVSAAFAHRWVRNGGTHNTGLWLDDNRIRKATPGY